ncbi:hypothetical protein Tco_0185023 [Tanacetum coccineum]
MSTSTMDHFTPSPNEKYYRSSVFPKIKHIFDRILRRCFPKLKENNAFFRPLDGEARKYGDYVCFNVFEICEELRKNNPDLFDERKPKDIAMESTIPLNEIISQIPSSIAITPILLTLEPEDSLIMGNEELNTIPEKESDEVIKSSVENLVPIPSEFEDTSESDSDCDLPSDDESLSDEDVLEDNVKIYSNPLFEFDDVYISSDVNPIFDEVLENIESKDSDVSNFDEPALLVTPLSDANKDECFNPGGNVDEIEFLLHRDPSTPKLSVASILEGFTDEPPLEENDDLFDLESKENEWKKILYNAPIDDLMTEDKIFDPEIHETIFFSNICELTL